MEDHDRDPGNVDTAAPGPGVRAAADSDPVQGFGRVVHLAGVDQAAIDLAYDQVRFPRSAGPAGGADRAGIGAIDTQDAGGDQFGTPDQVQRHATPPVEGFTAASAGDGLTGLMTQPVAGQFVFESRVGHEIQGWAFVFRPVVEVLRMRVQ